MASAATIDLKGARPFNEQAEVYVERLPLPADEARWFAEHVRAGQMTVESALACMDVPPEIERAVEELAGQDMESAGILRAALDFRRAVRDEFLAISGPRPHFSENLSETY